MACRPRRGRCIVSAVISGFGLLAFVACGSGTSGGGAVAEPAGCEAECRLSLECALGAPPDAVAACTDVCVAGLGEASLACRAAIGTLGRCARGKSCDELGEGACAEEIHQASAACKDRDGGGGGPFPDGGEGGAAPDAEAGESCAHFDFVVDGEACVECDYVECGCDGAPKTLSACTPHGCIVEARCEALCEASVSETLDCTDTYRISGQDGGVCSRRTCASAEAECGELDDGCGGTVSCPGTCDAPDTCGGGGIANRCGCTPLGCSEAEAECGLIDDGCGQELDCGGCSGVDWCGGGGVENRCGCASGEHTAGPRGPGAAASVEGPGGRVWSNPEAILADNTTATSLRVGSDSSQWLVASGFSLDVPPAAEIHGIEVRVRRRSRDGGVADNGARLVRGDAILPTDRSLDPFWAVSFREVVYGGPEDLWGEGWSPAQLNAPSFGFALAATRGGTAGNDDAFVAYVSVTVHYSVTCE